MPAVEPLASLSPAPVITLQGELTSSESHTAAGDGGPDDPRFVGTVCPTS